MGRKLFHRFFVSGGQLKFSQFLFLLFCFTMTSALGANEVEIDTREEAWLISQKGKFKYKLSGLDNPLFDETHVSAIELLGQAGTIVTSYPKRGRNSPFTDEIATLKLKPGYSKTYENKYVDNVVFLEPEIQSDKNSVRVVLAQATVKKAGKTFVFVLKLTEGPNKSIAKVSRENLDNNYGFRAIVMPDELLNEELSNILMNLQTTWGELEANNALKPKINVSSFTDINYWRNTINFRAKDMPIYLDVGRQFQIIQHRNANKYEEYLIARSKQVEQEFTKVRNDMVKKDVLPDIKNAILSKICSNIGSKYTYAFWSENRCAVKIYAHIGSFTNYLDVVELNNIACKLNSLACTFDFSVICLHPSGGWMYNVGTKFCNSFHESIPKITAVTKWVGNRHSIDRWSISK